MNVPKDQPLFFTVFASLCFLAILLMWVSLPVYHPELQEEEQAASPLEPEEAIQRAEEVLKRVEETIERVEAEQAQRRQQNPEQKTRRPDDKGGPVEESGKKKGENRRQQPSTRGEKIVQEGGVSAGRLLSAR